MYSLGIIKRYDLNTEEFDIERILSGEVVHLIYNRYRNEVLIIDRRYSKYYLSIFSSTLEYIKEELIEWNILSTTQLINKHDEEYNRLCKDIVDRNILYINMNIRNVIKKFLFT